MADTSKISLYGSVYNIKDSKSRQSIESLEGDVQELNDNKLDAHYIAETETISFTKGVVVV